MAKISITFESTTEKEATAGKEAYIQQLSNDYIKNCIDAYDTQLLNSVKAASDDMKSQIRKLLAGSTPDPKLTKI